VQEEQERRLADLAADIDLETVDPDLAGRFFLRRGSLLAARLNHDAALADFHEASTAFEEAGNVHGTGRAAYRRGIAHFTAADLTASADALTLAADRWTKADTPVDIASAQHALATVRMYQGETEQARKLFEEVLATRQALGDEEGILATRNNLATLAANGGHLSRARREYEAIIERLKNTTDRRGLAKAQQNLGSIFVQMKKHDEAAEQLDAARAIFEEIGDRAGTAELLHNAAFIGLDTGAYKNAHEGFVAALTIRREIGDEAGEGATLAQLGSIAADVLGRDMDGLRLMCAGQIILDDALDPRRFDVADWILELAEEMGLPVGEELDQLWLAAYDTYRDDPDTLLSSAFPEDASWPEPKRPTWFPM
jgi:tetratricopeptide (TPR) repeat protein